MKQKGPAFGFHGFSHILHKVSTPGKTAWLSLGPCCACYGIIINYNYKLKKKIILQQ